MPGDVYLHFAFYGMRSNNKNMKIFISVSLVCMTLILQTRDCLYGREIVPYALSYLVLS